MRQPVSPEAFLRLKPSSVEPSIDLDPEYIQDGLMYNETYYKLLEQQQKAQVQQ